MPRPPKPIVLALYDGPYCLEMLELVGGDRAAMLYVEGLLAVFCRLPAKGW